MRFVRAFWSKIGALLGRSRFEQEMDAEIQDHLAQLEARFIEQGMTTPEAHAAARRTFGGIDGLKEANREQRSFPFLENTWRDFRFAFRSLRKNPGFAIVAIITLALGIGANTAIFSVLNGVLLRPLPYQEDSRLVLIRQQLPLARVQRMNFSVHDIEDYRSQNRSFSSIVEYHEMSFVLLGGEEPQRVQTGVVSWNFFDELGVKPMRGRTFRASDEQHDADAVLLLSYTYWQKNFGGDPKIVGRVFEMNDRPHTVIGVLPPVPQFPQENDVYMPTSACPTRSSAGFISNRNARMMGVLGRLKPNVSLENAQADLEIVAGRLQTEYPESYSKSGGYRVATISLKDQLTQNIKPTLWVLLFTAGFVLLIVCASVANLMLARLLQREREMSLRAALGASRLRLLTQVLTESLTLAISGGVLGLVVAFSTINLLIAFAARFTPRAAEITIDGRVLLFTAGISIFTGLVFGCIPAFTSRRDLAMSLKAATRHSTNSARHQRLRNALIVFEVAAAFVLLVGAGLTLRSLIKLQNVDLGIKPENTLSARVDLNFSKYGNPETSRNFYSRLLERLRAIPTVTVAAAGSTFPLNGQRPSNIRLSVKDQPVDEGRPTQAEAMTASPGYFQALGIPVRAGRDFTDRDRAGSLPVAIVNDSMARHYWNGKSPLDRQISIDNGTTWLTIVGVVADARHTLDGDIEDSFYLPVDQFTNASTILIRTTGNPASIESQVRAAVHAIDPDQPVDSFRTLEELRSDSIASPRLTVALLALFAGLALLITATGIGGVIGFFVNQRRNEIGVRMALGAERSAVLWMVFREGMILAAIGVLLGVAGAIALGRLMSGLLFRTPAADPTTFAAVALLVSAAAACACLMPAYRAASVDSTIALRSE
jgi:putative ABC transport system permease protein